MEITSTEFGNNQKIPEKFTCDGKDKSPPLKMSQVPGEARSLALIVDDPDAPNGCWIHWLLWNIDPKTPEIKEGTAPEGATQGTNDFGKTGYGGPCPPSGEHRYFFKLYALDVTFSLGSSAKKDELEKAMEGHILEQAELIGTYSRG